MYYWYKKFNLESKYINIYFRDIKMFWRDAARTIFQRGFPTYYETSGNPSQKTFPPNLHATFFAFWKFKMEVTKEVMDHPLPPNKYYSTTLLTCEGLQNTNDQYFKILRISK